MAKKQGDSVLPNYQSLLIRVPEQMVPQLDAVAQLQMTSRNAVIRQMLQKELKRLGAE